MTSMLAAVPLSTLSIAAMAIRENEPGNGHKGGTFAKQTMNYAFQTVRRFLMPKLDADRSDSSKTTRVFS
jgi:hypothetical protein